MKTYLETEHHKTQPRKQLEIRLPDDAALFLNGPRRSGVPAVLSLVGIVRWDNTRELLPTNGSRGLERAILADAGPDGFNVVSHFPFQMERIQGRGSELDQLTCSYKATNYQPYIYADARFQARNVAILVDSCAITSLFDYSSSAAQTGSVSRL